MAASQPFGRFLLWSGLLTGAGALACAALVLTVDPYRLVGWVDRPGFNHDKPQPEHHQKQIKLAAARALGANVLIVGNSRAEIGLDPDYPALAAGGLQPYNLALAGTRIQVARAQLDQLHRAGVHPRHLIVGAEFLDFPVDPAAPARVVPPTEYPGAMEELAWRFDTAFSLDALGDALRTVRLQHAPNAPRMSARGFNPLAEYRQMARDEGYYALFQQRAADYAKRFAKLPRGLAGPDGASTEFTQLRAVIGHGAADGARVDVVIYPYHAQIMALIEAAGMDPMLDSWRVQLVRAIAAERAAHPGVTINLWDFSGYGERQCEAIPAKGDRKSETRWYWEAGHFKAAMGQLMLARMLGQPEADPAFGVALEADNLAQNRARIDAERAACAAARPNLFSDAQAMLPHAR